MQRVNLNDIWMSAVVNHCQFGSHIKILKKVFMSGSCVPVLELESRNCFWVQKTEFRRRPLQIALPAVAYEFRKLSFAIGHCRLPYRQWPMSSENWVPP